MRLDFQKNEISITNYFVERVGLKIVNIIWKIYFLQKVLGSSVAVLACFPPPLMRDVLQSFLLTTADSGSRSRAKKMKPQSILRNRGYLMIFDKCDFLEPL